MSVRERLEILRQESEIYRKKTSETDKPSFFYFVEHCGRIKSETEELFTEVSEMRPDESDLTGKNMQTVAAVRRVANKTMTEQKLIAKASEPPISRIWTTEGIKENAARIKKLEQTAAMKTENLDRLEETVSVNMTVGNYKSVRSIIAQGLKDKIKNPRSSVRTLIPVKYQAFIGKNEIHTIDILLNFISAEMNENGILEIENMNYVEVKYSILMFIMALRITYRFPPNYEACRFCAMLPKNPNGNSELVQNLPDLIGFADAKISEILKLAKAYEKFEHYEAKVLGLEK